AASRSPSSRAKATPRSASQSNTPDRAPRRSLTAVVVADEENVARTTTRRGRHSGRCGSALTTRVELHDRHLSLRESTKRSWTTVNHDTVFVVLDQILGQGAMQGVAVAGKRRGQRDVRIGKGPRNEPFVKSVLCADLEGFSLHAAVRAAADNRRQLEHLCRYAGRPDFPGTRSSCPVTGSWRQRSRSARSQGCPASLETALRPGSGLDPARAAGDGIAVAGAGAGAGSVGNLGVAGSGRVSASVMTRARRTRKDAR
ncbi:MAG: hypothetical protein ACI9SE_004617, partial [Neolewinella sp.]